MRHPVPGSKRGVELLEQGPRAGKLSTHLEHLSYEDRLKELGLVSLIRVAEGI